MPDREMILAILQSDIALAGLTLVFSGFLITKADSFGSRYGDRLKWMAVGGFVPAMLALLAALACILGLQGNVWGAYYSLGLP
jgi:hypothetical protein